MSQKTNSMLKLALVFFISLLSFSIGTYVGKKYSDNQYKLSQLEPNKKEAHGTANEFATSSESEEHGETKHETKHEGDSQNLTDSEVAKIAEEFAAEQPADVAHDEKVIQTTEADEHEIKTIADKPAVHTAKAMPAKLAPSKTAAVATRPTSTERVPSSLPPAKEVTPAHFTVQIGSFPAEPDAEKMTKELLAKGIKTSYVAAQVNGQTYYRVNVGLFGSAKEAQDYKKEFLEKTKISSAFVQKVQ